MTKLERNVRNERIREMYKDGSTYEDMRIITGLTRQHLWRILQTVDKSVDRNVT